MGAAEAVVIASIAQQFGGDLARTDFQRPVAPGTGDVIGSGDIGMGQLAQFLHEGLPDRPFGHITAVEQNVGTCR